MVDSLAMPKHVVVDGSNLATEGRSMPSLRQLSEAVEAYMADNPTDVITVVVDATFGHRIDASEVPEFDAAVENNEIVSPPAGAIGRGDAFVLTIANKANAVILSNDSFQEFHPDYQWLFDEGRLVGGKPVPHVGWVFVARSPVRGIVSRRATKAKKAKERGPVKAASAKPSALALEPMPVPKMPPPRRNAPSAKTSDAPAKPAKNEPSVAPKVEPAKPKHGEAAKAAPNAPMVNELLPFLAFVENSPVGSLVDAKVDSYSSHGAYATCADGVRLYIPMRSMATPAPRSAREVLSLGETRSFIVVSFNPNRRGIDVGLPGVVTVEAAAPPKKAAKKTAKKAGPSAAAAAAEPVAAAAPKASAPKASAPKASAPKASSPKAPAKDAAKKAVAKRAAEKKPAALGATSEPPAAKKAAVKKAAVKKAVAVKSPEPIASETPAKKAAATKKAPVAKTPSAKKAAAPKPAAPVVSDASVTKVAPAKKAPTKKAAPAEPAAKAAPVKKAPTKKASEKAVVASKTPAKKAKVAPKGS
jgi:Zc3h12a-like Ribonuclease NYN domain